MERLKQIIEDKYYWMPQMRISLDWAEMALANGMDTQTVINFVAKKLFAREK